MAKETMEAALKRFDERYFKLRLNPTVLNVFGSNLDTYIRKINKAVKDNESEEHIKNIVNSFLIRTWRMEIIQYYSRLRIYKLNIQKRTDILWNMKMILRRGRIPEKHLEKRLVGMDLYDLGSCHDLEKRRL